MKAVRGISAAMAMLVLIIDSKCAFDGALEGVNLCLKTVVPSLFPFFLLSNLMTSSIGKGAGGIFLSGLLGGYPVGAQAISQAYTERRISKFDAERLLPVCNQCGPAFIFGMTAAVLQDVRSCFVLWGLQLLSVATLSKIIPRDNGITSNAPRTSPFSLSVAMSHSVSAMASVCGWIVMFRMLYGFLERWILWLFPVPVQVFICGLLELANGCTELRLIGDSDLRFLLCAVMVSFGGICVTMQTYSVLHLDLSRRYYFPGKGIQVGLMALFVALIQRKFTTLTVIFVVIGMICVIFFRIEKKTVAFSGQRVYNGRIKDTRILPCSLEKRYPAPACTAPEAP